jgi:hypothetical protein
VYETEILQHPLDQFSGMGLHTTVSYARPSVEPQLPSSLSLTSAYSSLFRAKYRSKLNGGTVTYYRNYRVPGWANGRDRKKRH